jgi:hypothetical protein
MSTETQNAIDESAGVPTEILPMLMPTVQQVGLGAVLDVKDKNGKIIGHYQWATHKDGKMDSLVVVNVVKSHDGTEQVLYKTYSESSIAKKVTEEATGAVDVKENLATVKLGETYKAHNGTVSNYGIGDLLSFQLTGFVLVLCVLASLWGLISLISYIVRILGLAEQPKPAQPKPATAISASSAKTIHPGMSDEQFVAIISAAAAQALGGTSVSVVKFKPLNTMDWTWAIQGRVSLHTHTKKI